MITDYRIFRNCGLSIIRINAAIILLLFTSCVDHSQSKEKAVVSDIGQRKSVTLTVLDSLSFDQSKSMARRQSNVIDLFGSLLTISEPFDSQLRIFDTKKKELVRTIPLREVIQSGNERLLIGGTAIGTYITKDHIFSLESGRAKIVQYDLEGSKIKTLKIPDQYQVPIEKPGIFKASKEGVFWSFDDVRGRIATKKINLKNGDGIINVMTHEGQVRSLVSAKDLREVSGVEQLPFIRAATYGGSYFVTFTNQGHLYNLNEHGDYVNTIKLFSSVVDLSSIPQSDLTQGYGVQKIQITDQYYAFFLKIRDPKNGSARNEIVGINKHTGDYWRILSPLNGYSQPLEFNKGILSYLVTHRDGTSVLYLAKLTIENLE